MSYSAPYGSDCGCWYKDEKAWAACNKHLRLLTTLSTRRLAEQLARMDARQKKDAERRHEQTLRTLERLTGKKV